MRTVIFMSVMLFTNNYAADHYYIGATGTIAILYILLVLDIGDFLLKVRQHLKKN